LTLGPNEGKLECMAKPKTSGTVWTEAQIGARWESVKLRLQPGYKARLEALARAAGLSMGALVQGWIDSAGAGIKKSTKAKR
jgi:hypothetical protein